MLLSVTETEFNPLIIYALLLIFFLLGLILFIQFPLIKRYHPSEEREMSLKE